MTIRDIGHERQLFIDGRFIEASAGIALTMNPPVQHPEPVLVADRPWEPMGLAGYATVLREPDGRYRMWYGGVCKIGLPSEGAIRLCYAESSDGVHWEKPTIGRLNFEGSKDNNIVAPPLERQSMQGATVYRDEDAPPDRRYRLWTKFRPTDDELAAGAKPGLYAMHSPDGIDWTIDENQPNPQEVACDTQNMFFFDHRIGRWVGYTRNKRTQWVGEAAEARGHRYRSIARMTSPDFVNWSNVSMEETQTVIAPDQRDRWAPTPDGEITARTQVDVYTSCAMPYPWAQDVYIAMPAMYYHWDESEAPAKMDVQLLTSRDGIRWRRQGDRAPFLRLGRDGSRSSGMIMAVPWLIDRGEDLCFYHTGTSRLHRTHERAEDGDGIFRCTMRKDGFVSADAGYDGGAFSTPLITFDGGRLELNVQCSAGGWVRVGLVDEHNAPIEGRELDACDTLNGDGIAKTVRWAGKSDVSDLHGRPVRLRVEMRDARLFAFGFVK